MPSSRKRLRFRQKTHKGLVTIPVHVYTFNTNCGTCTAILHSCNIFAVHVPWLYMLNPNQHLEVPNLSSLRQNEHLIALGGAIRRVRKEKKISQEKLALKAELDRSYMGCVERGDNNVALLTLLKIANALDVKMSVLLDAADP